jgi:hypothetical protein
MEKAHLFHAVYVFNQGIDDAVRGVRRLKKAPELTLDTYLEGAAELELRRSKVNVQFLTDLVDRETADLKHFDEEYDELIDEPLSLHHDKICQLMRIVEQQRKEEGKPPMVQFTEAAPPLEKATGDNPAAAAPAAN